jgi:hypothetical protein
MRLFRVVALLFGLAALGGLGAVFFMPTTWEVTRQREIAAPAAAIYPHLVDLRRWNVWSPWQETAYPGLVFHYAGPASGVGAEVSWDSKATGDGSLRIVGAEAPWKVRVARTVQKGKIRSLDTIRLEPRAGGRTLVTWEDRGDLGRTLLGRLSLSLVEELMAKDLERALGGLAAAAEGRANETAAAALPADTPSPPPTAASP